MRRLMWRCLLAGVVTLAATTSARSAQGPSGPGPREALTGLDPILLAGGKDVLGKPALFSDFEGFRYLFSTAETKATFDADPGRHGIQLGAACARMGARVPANPEIFTVLDGRIYGFASANCHKLFVADPKTYLPALDTITPAVGADLARARALVRKAAGVAGGEALLARLTSWEETQTQPSGGPTPLTVVSTSTMTNRFTEVTTGLRSMQRGSEPVLASTTLIVDGATAEMSMGDQKQVRHPGFRDAMLETMHRHPMALLAAALRPDTPLSPLGPGLLAGTPVEFVRVGWANTIADLAMTADGALAGVRFKINTAPDGVWGPYERVITARQNISGLMWPTEYQTVRNGVPAPQPVTMTNVKVTFAQK